MAVWQNSENSPEWDNFLLSQNITFLQSSCFGKFHKALGNKTWYLVGEESGRIVGTALIVKQQSRLGSFLYCPGGPVLTSWVKELTAFLEKLVAIGKEEAVDFIRLDPRVLTEEQIKMLEKLHFKKASYFTQPQSSQIIDLNKSFEEIRSGFSDSTRHNISWVERKGLEVKISSDPDQIDLFSKLLKETSERQKFHLHRQENYYKQQYQTFLEKGLAKLFLTYEPKELGTDVLAASIVVNFGDTVTYLHAASSSKNPKLRAPYLMQWKIIENAKLSGFTNYDFWGVSSTDDPKDPWAGVSAFKSSFGGEKVSYSPPYDLILSPKYYLIATSEKLRKLIRKIS